ncbi:O-acetyl-ADP-ribose deacetylase [Flavobacterium sp. NRK F10]|uniref:O-acetyl-ADP-ribose deacetylase n=1 Tax=Flavobacterium sp. NRK F10 TaxID=2954931 RepID=UPI002091CB71|nr:O-acetyl-ADP-ribose deacetylase [Flavobacterium sp. NRK F10]MCO6174651.1 O-acetyl-ADP-ribose deacetylase [Flavobacterium sp. NRK F10]
MEIKLIQGDITQIKAEGIVNAANTSLLGGGGVDGAIHKAGGKLILEECIAIRNRQGGCNVGEAVITTAGNLPAKYVIHTVGPVWNGNKTEKEQLLASCYSNCLRIAEEYQLKTIVFPNISTGIYRFPKDRAAKIAIDTIKQFQTQSIQEITFVCFDEENYKLYQQLL